MRFFQAIMVFFKVLFDRDFAEQVRRLSSGERIAESTKTETAVTSAAPPKPKPRPAARNDAITLLATLQREARFVDIVMEPLADYTDAQVGAATRDVLRDCGQTLERLFAIRAVVDAEEGAAHETPADADPARYRLTGNVTGDPPYHGQLVHHGWQATRCELPKWSGSDGSAMILAPVELELT
jgi:hypothetical protein